MMCEQIEATKLRKCSSQKSNTLNKFSSDISRTDACTRRVLSKNDECAYIKYLIEKEKANNANHL